MQIHVVNPKIDRVKVTGADLNYIGSITIDEDLMDAAKILKGEKVQIVNNNNGERLETYASTSVDEAQTFKPALVFRNEQNNLLT
jgi:aspartate 1-decarboxylase